MAFTLRSSRYVCDEEAIEGKHGHGMVEMSKQIPINEIHLHKLDNANPNDK